MPLADLDAMAVRAWLAKLEREGVAASTRAKSYRLLSRILGTAVEGGYLTRNPCTIRGAAAERAPEMRFATVAEVAALADAIPPRFRALVLVAAYAGLRWGELAGLRRQAGGPAASAGSRWPSSSWRSAAGSHVGPPKTGAGRRTVTLPTVAAEALAEHLSVYAEAGPDGLVFPAERGGPSVAATSPAGSGSRPPEPPGSRGFASMTCATPPPPWRSPPAPAPGS